MRADCAHCNSSDPEGLALITVGDCFMDNQDTSLILPKALLGDVCRFDLGSVTGSLARCLIGHKAAVIVDSTRNGAAPGTVSIVDLSLAAARGSNIKFNSCHTGSFVEQLGVVRESGRMPKRIVLVGVEVETDSCGWGEHATGHCHIKPSGISARLPSFVAKVLESLKRDA